MKYLIAICFFLLTGCSRPSLQSNFTIPGTKDVNEVIKAVLSYDSLYIGNSPVSIDLEKVRVYVTTSKNKIDIPPINFRYTLSLSDLIYSNSERQKYFGKKDSLYLLFQNDILKTFRIEKELVKTATTRSEQEQNRKSGNRSRYFDISIPIFSADLKNAYVGLNYFCSECGGGSEFFLEKIKGRWKVKMVGSTWRS